ncbi:MAG: NAD(P)-dependent oxidoreductase [Kiritimatiellaceae bacterium]|nr:NAD(P)-dependent oxidoreductase [Kiritimatiellaceae bacterium]
MSAAEKSSEFYWPDQRVLITGADGFLGGAMTRSLLSRGASVYALVWSGNQECDVKNLMASGAAIVRGDVADISLLTSLCGDSGINTVFHLAAINSNTGTLPPYALWEANIRGVYTVLEACRAASPRARVIIASSREAEECFSGLSARPHHPYMVSKASAELIARSYSDTFNLPSACVRSDNLYGGGDRNWQRLIPGTIRSLLQGEAPVIRGDGQLARAYVYIDDAVNAYCAIAERLHRKDIRGQIFRLSTGINSSVLDTVRQLVEISGRNDLDPRILHEKCDERVDEVYMPVREKQLLDWENTTGLHEGLARTYEWYRTHSGELS